MLSPKKRAEQDNRLTLVAILDLFDVLSGANAIIGRYGRTIVLRWDHIPSIIDHHQLISYRLDATDGFGCTRVFPHLTWHDSVGSVGFWDIGIPLIEDGGENPDWISHSFFPCLSEVRAAILSRIPELDKERSRSFSAIQQRNNQAFTDAFSAALENTHSGISQGGADDWEEFGSNPDTSGARDTLH